MSEYQIDMLRRQVAELTQRVMSLEDALCAIAGVSRGVTEDKATPIVLVKRAKAARVG